MCPLLSLDWPQWRRWHRTQWEWCQGTSEAGSGNAQVIFLVPLRCHKESGATSDMWHRHAGLSTCGHSGWEPCWAPVRWHQQRTPLAWVCTPAKTPGHVTARPPWETKWELTARSFLDAGPTQLGAKSSDSFKLFSLAIVCSQLVIRTHGYWSHYPLKRPLFTAIWSYLQPWKLLRRPNVAARPIEEWPFAYKNPQWLLDQPDRYYTFKEVNFRE